MGTKPFKPSFIVPMSHFNHEQSIFIFLSFSDDRFSCLLYKNRICCQVHTDKAFISDSKPFTIIYCQTAFPWIKS